MNNIYPYGSAVIMNDTHFRNYGGDITKLDNNQRDFMYWLAEMKVCEDLDTFLIPTTVTGTFTYNPLKPFITTYTYVNSINVVRFLDRKETVYYSVSGTNNIYVSLRDDKRGIIDIDYLVGNCRCHTHSTPSPYQIQVIYNAGLPTGTSLQPTILFALTVYSDVLMNEIMGFGNESTGDIGVQEFRSQDYSEKRVALMRTTFGSSARANFVHGLLTGLRTLRHVGL